MDINKVRKTALNGLIGENPIFRLMLGMCPTLAMSASLKSAVFMGIATTFVLTLSNIIISALNKIIPDKVRIPSYIVIIASLVTVLAMVVRLPALKAVGDSLGSFLKLIVVNCIILGRAEAFANKNSVGYSAIDGLSMGIGFTIAMAFIALFREFFGSGSLWGLPIMNFQIKVLSMAIGGFIVIGLFMGGFNYVVNVIEKNKKSQALYATAEEGNE